MGHGSSALASRASDVPLPPSREIGAKPGIAGCLSDGDRERCAHSLSRQKRVPSFPAARVRGRNANIA